MKHCGYNVPLPMPFHSFLCEGYSFTDLGMNYFCECFIFLHKIYVKYFYIYVVLYTILVRVYGHKRVNIAILRLLPLERSACKVCPWLVSENLDFKRFPLSSEQIREAPCA